MSQKLTTLVHAYVLTSNAIVVCTSEGQLVWSVGREYHLVAVQRSSRETGTSRHHQAGHVGGTPANNQQLVMLRIN